MPESGDSKHDPNPVTAGSGGNDSGDVDATDRHSTNNDFTSLHPGGGLIGSFAIVTFCYVLMYIVVSMGLVHYLMCVWFAPEVAEVFSKEPDVFEQILRADPEYIWPVPVARGYYIGGGAFAFLIGLLVTKLARFNKFAHGAILTLLTLFTSLQLGLTNDFMPQWVTLLNLLVFTPAIFAGSLLGSWWFASRP